jgi:hypothetical protein
MTYSSYPESYERSRVSALEYARTLASSTGKVAEIVEVTQDQFMQGEWPPVGQEVDR